ncbi:MAG: GntR family transcriptional regulator [Phycisphaerales bacterium]|nr:GntR family transcriptional regulator [Phycisphaerales bacterium]
MANGPRYLEIARKFEAKRALLEQPLKLPSEQRMAMEYRIARDTLRRALVLLESRGAVTRRRGRGTFLRPLQAQPKSARGSSIGFIPPWWATSVNTWYTATVFDGISSWADRHDCRLSVMHVDRYDNDEHKLLEKISTRDLTGLLWVHPVPEQKSLLTAVGRHVPCVVVGREYEDANVHAVLPDYRQAMALMDEHLMASGHSIYSIIGRGTSDPYGASWLAAARDAHARRGSYFDDHDYYVNITPFDREKLVELLMDFHLPTHPKSRALVLTSSSYLIHLLARERFRQAMGGEISVVAFDYGEQAMESYWPGRTITHVKCNWDEIGRKAIEVLFSLIERNDAPRTIHEPVALVKGSTVARFPT